MNHDLNPDRVKEDPALSSQEKATSFWFAKTDDRMIVSSDEAGITRRLLQHPEAEPDTEHMRFGPDGEIYSYYGTAPVGCLKMLASSRDSSGHASVVTETVLYDRSEEGDHNEGYTTHEDTDTPTTASRATLSDHSDEQTNNPATTKQD